MQDWQLFASPPFWAIFIGTLLVVLLAVEGGYSWGTVLIAEPQRTEIRKTLRKYVEDRLTWTGSDRTPAARSTSELLDRLSA